MGVLPSNAAASRAHELVMSWGRNSTASHILNPAIRLMFGEGDTVVGYLRRNSWLLVAGEPICRLDVLPSAVEEFEAWARDLGLGVCYVCASDSLRDLLAGSAD